MITSIFVFAQGLVNTSSLPNVSADKGTADKALTILFSVVGAMAFLIVLIASINYVTSRGEPDKISRSRNTIIYAMIGVVVSALAVGIVNYVLKA